MEIPKYSILKIRAGGVMQNVVNNRKYLPFLYPLYRVVVLKEPPEIIYTGLKRQLGAPKELNYNDGAQSKVKISLADIKIPLSETNEYKGDRREVVNGIGSMHIQPPQH